MLTVISVSEEDGGDYTCVATNNHGQDMATANLMPICEGEGEGHE